MITTRTVNIRSLCQQDYAACWQAMQQFTHHRTAETLDEIWLLEHSPVFTQGQNGKAEHILRASSIPVIQTDRGGQVTYHGPGQLMIYTLIDLKRKKWTVRELVTRLENTIIDLLAHYHVLAYAKQKAPGVYVAEKKICSIGLRIRRGCAYHGLALNVAMDMEPFTWIHPCGFPELQMTQLSTLVDPAHITETGETLKKYLLINLGYTHGNETSQ